MRIWNLLRLLWQLSLDTGGAAHDLRHLRLMINDGHLQHPEKLRELKLAVDAAASDGRNHRTDLDAQHAMIQDLYGKLKELNAGLARLGAEVDRVGG